VVGLTDFTSMFLIQQTHSALGVTTTTIFHKSWKRCVCELSAIRTFLVHCSTSFKFLEEYHVLFRRIMYSRLI